MDIPGKGINALRQNWRFDLSAGLSAALVALPLSLGIAIAADVAPVAGLFAAIIGGLIGGFFSGTNVGIKGPSAALIPVILMAKESFEVDALGSTYAFLLAAFFVSGVIQILMGFLKLGVIGDFFPASVVKGLLAAVGLIILTKQIGPGLGVDVYHESNLDVLLNIGDYVLKLNPFVAVITLNGIVLLILLPRFRNQLIRMLPPAMWVLLVSYPFSFFFDFHHEKTVEFLNSEFTVGPQNLIEIPANIFSEIAQPNFGLIGTFKFWRFAFTITLISTIENLASAKAIENLDPFNRKSFLNRDLISSGLCTVASSMVGGLPVITVIARTSININHGAKTLWSNLFHGLICLAVILLFGSWFENIPLAALSAILIFTGYKLASPKVFRDSFRIGIEQIIILVSTIVATLAETIPFGIAVGILVTLVVHGVRSGMSTSLFLKYLVKPQLRVVKEQNDHYLVRFKGIANFFNILRIQKNLKRLPDGAKVVLEFSNTRLVDFTVLEFLDHYAREYNSKGGQLEIIGLDIHETSSNHPYSLHVHLPEKIKKLTKRQMQLELLAFNKKWKFNPEMDWEIERCRDFHFFDTRSIEYRKNTIHGVFRELDVSWVISDITFDEGALLATEVYRSTMQIIDLPFSLPEFTLEKEHLMDRVLELAGVVDIDFTDHKKFSKNFMLHGDQTEEIHQFFTQELLDFFVNHEVYRIESNGKAILLFHNFRLGSVEGIKRMIDYSHELTTILSKISKQQED